MVTSRGPHPPRRSWAPGRILLAALVVLSAAALAGCLGSGPDGGGTTPASEGPAEARPADGNGTRDTGENRTASGDGTASGNGTASEEGSGGNGTRNATQESTRKGTRNSTQTGRYTGPGYPSPPAARDGCDDTLGGACFPLNGTEEHLVVEELGDDAAGPLPAAYILFWDANGTVRDAGEADGWVCTPSEPLEVPDWAATASVHAGDPASATTQGGCGPAPPATQGTASVRFQWRPAAG